MSADLDKKAGILSGANDPLAAFGDPLAQFVHASLVVDDTRFARRCGVRGLGGFSHVFPQSK